MAACGVLVSLRPPRQRTPGREQATQAQLKRGDLPFETRYAKTHAAQPAGVGREAHLDHSPAVEWRGPGPVW